MSKNFDEEILNIFQFTHENESFSPTTMVTKLFEEGGELAEVVLAETGVLAYKDKEFEPVVEEAADVINVTIGLLSQVYPDKSPHELHAELLEALKKKSKKYNRILITRRQQSE